MTIARMKKVCNRKQDLIDRANQKRVLVVRSDRQSW
jgi:hypothetical protein